MKSKQNVFFLTLLSLLSLSFVSAIPATAFTSDSLSQQVGDVLTWKVTYKAADYNPTLPYLKQQGDTLRVEVTKANTTDFEGSTWDTLFGDVYNNSVLYKTEARLASYNGTHARISSISNLIIPHNETALLLMYNGTQLPIYWTSGPNGYDGLLSSWMSGSGLGDLGVERMDYQYNAEGLAETLRHYNGTGPGWDFKYQADLLPSTDDGIPGFELLFTVFGIFAIMGLLILNRSRKLQLK